MRNVIFSINLTLDGCCDHTTFNPDEEIYDYFTQLMREADTIVSGRITYHLMVPFWPDVAKNKSGDSKAMNDFAQAFDDISRIIVFSKTLEKVEGKNTTLMRSNLQEEILKLKQEEGKSILLDGINLSSQLIGHDLVDDYRIVVHPVVAGAGRRLFDDVNLLQGVPLKLVETKTFKTGSVALHYVKQ